MKSKISTVTVTGADDSISPLALEQFTGKFPFILEWGILFSESQQSSARFPSKAWLSDFANESHKFGQLSAHLCGKWVRDLINGNGDFIDFIPWAIFKRVQINFHSIPHKHSLAMIDLLKRFPEKEFIFQYDGVNTGVAFEALEAGVNCSILFDKSGGAGILPDAWPEAIEKIRCGYAGGLSPANVGSEIVRIRRAASSVLENDTWIDVETWVRSSDDSMFDLIKVMLFLENCKDAIK